MLEPKRFGPAGHLAHGEYGNPDSQADLRDRRQQARPPVDWRRPGGQPSGAAPALGEGKGHVRLWLLLGLAAALLALSSSTRVGLGWDEPEYIQAGTAYTYWFTDAPNRTSDASIRAFWTWQHTHPPFGQLLAGIMVRLFGGLRLPYLGVVGIITAARIAPALCFGGTVALLAAWCERELGTRLAFLAGLSLVLFPRVFGAAQFVSLDVPMMFTWLLSVVTFLWAVRSVPPTVSLRALLAPRTLLAAGAFGLALLTKLNAFFLPLLLWPWALLRFGRRAFAPILASLLLAPLLFFVGWPWLYHDTVARGATYLLDKMGRPVLPVYYLGRAYVDQYAPWHYPLVMLAVTVPAGLLAASVLGLSLAVRSRPRRAPTELALVNLAGILTVAMLPWAPKYDGVRLFLPAFPFLAVLTGVGVEATFRWAARARWRRIGSVAVGAILLMQGAGLLWAWPFHLTYYNMLVGGLRGAEKLGFETIYWGEAFDPGAWAALEQLTVEEGERGGKVEVAFVGVAKEVPEFLQRCGYLSASILPVGPQATGAEYLVVGRREGYLAREGWLTALEPRVVARALFVRQKHGVPLCWIVQTGDVD